MSKCTETLNEVPKPKYPVAKRVGSSLPPISTNSTQKAFFKSSCETKRSIIDLTMTNMHCESENQRIPPIPSWTGFNLLLLQEQIPARSNIDYLPVVHGNPTQLSTVNAVFF